MWASESVVVWSEVSRGIVSNSWEEAKEAKRNVEEGERAKANKQQPPPPTTTTTWLPNHFTLSYTKETGWDCLPIRKWVPPAPIVVPTN